MPNNEYWVEMDEKHRLILPAEVMEAMESSLALKCC
jgi:DNA-binding transcriptional regulator/RsmH inhibitor MraZ